MSGCPDGLCGGCRSCLGEAFYDEDDREYCDECDLLLAVCECRFCGQCEWPLDACRCHVGRCPDCGAADEAHESDCAELMRILARQ